MPEYFLRVECQECISEPLSPNGQLLSLLHPPQPRGNHRCPVKERSSKSDKGNVIPRNLRRSAEECEIDTCGWCIVSVIVLVWEEV